MLINMSDILEPVKTLAGTWPVGLRTEREAGWPREVVKGRAFLGVDF